MKGEIQMFSMVEAQLRMRAELLISGQLSRLGREYCLPLVMQLGEDRLIILSLGEAMAIFATLRQALFARRVVAL